jgi:hypothetical protein
MAMMAITTNSSIKVKPSALIPTGLKLTDLAPQRTSLVFIQIVRVQMRRTYQYLAPLSNV